MVLFNIIMIIMIATELVSGTLAATIQWKNCTDPEFISVTFTNTNVECGFVSVPLDYAKPHGTKIQLAISRIKHTVSNDKFQGVMLVIGGDPGDSSLSKVTLGQSLPASVSATYDWIGLDPRGIGSSIPSLSCLSNFVVGPRPNPIPSNQKIENMWLNRSKDYAIACGKNNMKLLEHMTTIDIAKDIDSIRIALQQKQINYYGSSYGTYLGQVYATLFPNHVRRMVLDSNINPTRIWFQLSDDQPIGFDRNIAIWFGWLAKYNNVYHLGNTECEVAQRWDIVLHELAPYPANGTVGPDEWIDIFLYAAYAQSSWISLAEAFSQWTNDKIFDLLLVYYEAVDNPGYDNSLAAFLGITCTDTQWPQSWDYVRTEKWRTFSKAPIFTWENAWFNGPCQYWPAKASKLLNINGSKVGNILLIHETLDAATPFEGSLVVRGLFPGARLIAEPGGTTHAGSLQGNTCVDNLIINYLQSGAVPTRQAGNTYDVECAPLPEPVPPSVG